MGSKKKPDKAKVKQLEEQVDQLLRLYKRTKESAIFMTYWTMTFYDKQDSEEKGIIRNILMQKKKKIQRRYHKKYKNLS